MASNRTEPTHVFCLSVPILAVGLLLAWTSGGGETPWPADVPGFNAPEAGEHPRLLFRKSDLPALRERAKTPEGQAILKALRRQLNGSDGESMPAKFGVKGPVSKDGSGDHDKDPWGTYTISHVAGFGFLYQITGDKKYADLGKECMDKALEGYRDRDQRYSFRAPFGALRAGPSIGWYAFGYDLCYDGWAPDYRQKIAQAFANYNEGQWCSLDELVRGARQHPGSNHWGMQVGGGALAILSIMNDPGVDMKKIGPLLQTSQQKMIVNMTEGFGDGGFFAEGDGTGTMSSHIDFLSALQAWKVAFGKDFVSPRPNAQWMSLKWIFLSVPKAKAQPHDWFWPQRGGYPHNIWAREGKSGGGYFSIPFGILNDDQKAALLWFYNQHLRASDEKDGTPLDVTSPYPHHAVLSFVNWPLGLKEKNPGDVLPHAYRDTKWGIYACRNRWQDENDIVISVLCKRAKGNMRADPDGGLMVAAFGKHLKWGTVSGEVSDWRTAPDGSMVMTMADGTSTAVDFSKASSADGLLVTTSRAEGSQYKLGDKSLALRFLTSGAEPTAKVDGDKIVAGAQTISLANGTIVLGTMRAADRKER